MLVLHLSLYSFWVRVNAFIGRALPPASLEEFHHPESVLVKGKPVIHLRERYLKLQAYL